MFRHVARLILLAASAVLGFGSAFAAESLRIEGEYAWAQAKSAPAALLLDKATSAVDAITLPSLDQSLIGDAQRANRSAGVKAMKVGVNRVMNEAVGTASWAPDLQWQGANGKRVAQFRVASTDAAAMRVALTFKHLPASIELRVVGRDGEPVLGPINASDLGVQLEAGGRYWTPVTEGEAQWIEVSVPAGVDTASLGLVVENASHLFTSVSDRFKGAKGIGDSGSCEVDVACLVNPSAALLAAARSVARMLFSTSAGTFLCTGTLMNDADTGSQVPYFMTASHCISKQSEAGTLNTFWFYDAATCDSLATPGFTQLFGGATLLVNRPELDSTLLRLLNSAPVGSFFSGYDANTIANGTTITIVHHPQGDLKKVSQGRVTGFVNAGSPNLIAGGTFSASFILAGYTLASTEGGSSGGALLSFSGGEYLLRGTLYGGGASCSNVGDFSSQTNNFDYYSRFDIFYGYVKAYIGPFSVVPMVEFYNTGLNHYFVSQDTAEIAGVDSGAAGPNWTRTGLTYNVIKAVTSQYPNTGVTYRFYGTPGIGPNSHFYTADPTEFGILRADPGWFYEGVSHAAVRPSSGICPAGTSPVYRAYNNRAAQRDSNHRFSTNFALLNSMVPAGWIVEGVAECAPI